MNPLVIMKDITYVMSAMFAAYATYYVVFALLSLKKRRPFAHAAARHRFAVLIAARNEAPVIGQLVDSLQKQEYPRELFDIIVIPNNCTDNTAQVAAKAGARVLMLDRPVHSKGEVLSQTYQLLRKWPEKYDAICVFDADNVVDAGFLAAMNDALCAGVRVAQGYRDSKNPHDSYMSGCYSIYYWLTNRFFNKARNAVGMSAIINGSGFMVRWEVLKDMGGWNTLTITEDMEFTAQCALRGEKVEWVPEALTYDEQPLGFAQSWRQRKRWTTGLLQCASYYAVPLLKSALKRRSMTCWDLFLLFSTVVIQMFMLVSTLLDTSLNILSIRHQLFPLAAIYSYLLTSLDGSYIASMLAAISVVLLEKKMRPGILKGILAFWFFLLSWLPITLLCLMRRETTWEEIRHTRSLSVEEIEEYK